MCEIAYNGESLISIFQKFSFNKTFILSGGLGTVLSFYGIQTVSLKSFFFLVWALSPPSGENAVGFKSFFFFLCGHEGPPPPAAKMPWGLNLFFSLCGHKGPPRGENAVGLVGLTLTPWGLKFFFFLCGHQAPPS